MKVGTERFPFLLNLGSGPKHEPPVTDEAFLQSYIRVGVWLRVLAAHQHYVTLTSGSSSLVERYAAIVAIYQFAGMVYEDLVANLVAWAVKAKNKHLSFANILNATNLTRAAKLKPGNSSEPYHTWVISHFSCTPNSVRINPQLFLESLAILSETALLECLGIPWKAFPSVKLVPRESIEEWTTLPKAASALVNFLAYNNHSLLTKSYNKLKHGPQLVIAKLSDAIVARGQDASNFPRDKEFVRLLFSGDRTQESEHELASGNSVAPFFADDPELAKDIFYEVMVGPSHFMYLIGLWRFRCTFRRNPYLSDDKTILQINAQARKHVNARIFRSKTRAANEEWRRT